MKKEQTRTSFKSRWGFILASVGSAVGMANVWGFPNKMGSNGGGAFLLIYLLFIFLFSYVGLPAEFAIGRWSHTGTLGSYENAWRSRNEKLAPAGRALGWLPLAGSLCIAIGYSIIVAYVLKAFVDSASGLLMQVNTSECPFCRRFPRQRGFAHVLLGCTIPYYYHHRHSAYFITRCQ